MRALLRASGPILLVLASLLLAALVLELGMRAHEAWRRRAQEPWALFDTHLAYRLNPAHPEHNAHGFRDAPFPPASERFRVLMLGDSLAYTGDDADDTWVAHLRRELRGLDDASGVEVLNAAVPGYTNYQELRWLELHGLELEPDLVGVGFAPNDLYHFLQRFRIEDGRVTDRFEPTPEALAGDEPALGGLVARSRLAAWLGRRLAALGASWPAPGPDGFAFDRRIDLRAAWQDAPWKDIEVQMRAMRRLGEREGFGLFLVAFPVAEQYDPQALARDPAYVRKPQRRLRELCDALSLPCLDLTPWIEPRRHLQRDGLHLTASGRRHVAEVTARFLVERGLLPGFKTSRGGAEASAGAYVPEGHPGEAMR